MGATAGTAKIPGLYLFLYNTPMSKKAKVLWVDLEMTGLDPRKDKIVEVAAVMTDWDFNEIAVFESGVGQDEKTIKKMFAANDWAMNRPAETQELIDLSLRSLASKHIEKELVELVKTHFDTEKPVLLGGNSIHMDRRFIIEEWPELDKLLHYRMLDVSAWKVVFDGRYGKKFAKPENHRALEDIRGSIMELKYYLGKVTK